MRSLLTVLLAVLLGGCGARSGLETPPPCESDADCGDAISDVCAPRRVCMDGACVAAPALDCDDRSECTVDRCDSSLALCVNTPRDDDEDGFGPLECGGADCDDANAGVSPGVTERCAGGVDEDCDMRTDCSDPDCFGAPGCEDCAPERCTGGVDDDCDGLVDCGDSDCLDSPDCCGFAELECADGRDDDCDGFVDCEDLDCARLPVCCEAQPETCNGLDDDCDGVVDDGLACFTLDGAPLAAIEADQCGEAFYAYDNPDAASANPIPDVRGSDDVVVFVYHDTGGCGSSVTVIADTPTDGSGGRLAARFQISPSTAGGLVVSDEPGECMLSGSGAGTCTWRWEPCCTDGVMIGPFDEDFCVRLELTSPVGVDRLYVLDDGVERLRGFGTAMEICGSIVPPA